MRFSQWFSGKGLTTLCFIEKRWIRRESSGGSISPLGTVASKQNSWTIWGLKMLWKLLNPVVDHHNPHFLIERSPKLQVNLRSMHAQGAKLPSGVLQREDFFELSLESTTQKHTGCPDGWILWFMVDIKKYCKLVFLPPCWGAPSCMSTYHSEQSQDGMTLKCATTSSSHPTSMVWKQGTLKIIRENHIELS